MAARTAQALIFKRSPVEYYVRCARPPVRAHRPAEDVGRAWGGRRYNANNGFDVLRSDCLYTYGMYVEGSSLPLLKGVCVRALAYVRCTPS